MPVEDTFSISGRGTVCTGRIEQGCLKTGDDLEIVGLRPLQKTICTGEKNEINQSDTLTLPPERESVSLCVCVRERELFISLPPVFTVSNTRTHCFHCTFNHTLHPPSLHSHSHTISLVYTQILSFYLLLLGVEMFKKSMDYGQAGDNVGALLRGVKRDDVQRGQVLAQPGTVKTYKKFEVQFIMGYILLYYVVV